MLSSRQVDRFEFFVAFFIAEFPTKAQGAKNLRNGSASASGGRSDDRPQYLPPMSAGVVDNMKQVYLAVVVVAVASALRI